MEKLSLYTITNGFVELMNNNDLIEENKAQIEEELTILLQQKSENIIGYTKNIEATIDAIKSEEKRLAEKRKSLENKVEKFKAYVKDCMENSNILKVETILGTITVAKNPMSVEIIDENAIPSEYKEEVITTKINKKAILDNFKATGELIDGVVINTDNTSLRMR